MKKYNYKSAPFEIHGIPFFGEHGKLRRLPDSLTESIPALKDAAHRLSGARLMFRTNSKSIKIEMRVSNVYVDRGYAFYQSNVAPVFIGEHRTSRFAGILSADNSYDSDMIHGTFTNDGMNDVTVHLPQKPCVEDIDIYLDDDARVLAPTPFTVEKPFLFYGSSIVENGHCGVQNGYPALLAREFDADFYNLGVSGLARGELEFAQYITGIEHSVFFMDYDHNAPTPEHLAATHYPFYEYYRKKCPDTPVIMSSRPAFDDPTSPERLEIVRESYEKGIAAGDKNLYFVDGRTLFCGVDENICTTDRTHPNDLGHYMMYKRLAEVVEKIL